MEARFLNHNGGRIRYLVGGVGPPLVLCHGWNGSAENFETWFDELGARRTLIVPDFPGFGLSAPLGGPHTAEAIAVPVGAVIDHEGIDRFELGGLCLGVGVAMALLRDRMDRVDRLILHTPLLAPELVGRRFHRQARFGTHPLIFPAAVWLGRRRIVNDVFKRYVTEGKTEADQGATMNFENQLRLTPRASREWLLDGLTRDDRAMLDLISVPTLILLASDDHIVDVDGIRRIVATHPTTQLAIIEDAGHGWGADFVRRQNRVLTNFLDDRTPPMVTHNALPGRS